MRTTREFYDYYGDLRGLQNQDISWLAKNCQGLDEAWTEGSPNIVIWLATSVGVLPQEEVRMFALWSAVQVGEEAAKLPCAEALVICERYFNNPFPGELTNSFDLISFPSQAPRGGQSLCEIIFDMAEHRKRS